MAKNDYIRNGGLPAFGAHPDVNLEYDGLTKREYFAAIALQGLLASGFNSEMTVKDAVKRADQLLQELEKA